MDNHPLRINPLALQFLAEHHITVIEFPPHYTHLLQPFDVAVAHSFKSNIQNIFFDKKIKNQIKPFPTKVAQARFKLLYSITYSWCSVPRETLIHMI